MGANPLFTFLSYFHYLATAKGRHGTHSPFVYQLIQSVINKTDSFYQPDIETLLSQLAKDHSIIEFIDPKTFQPKRQRISHIANRSTSSVKFRGFLKGLTQYLSADRILETGTSLGFASAYLASSDTRPAVHSIEGNEPLAAIAQNKWAHLENLTIHQGTIYELYPQLLAKINPDMIFLDADHRPEAISFYIDHLAPSMANIKAIIIHDIYWSRSMNKVWQKISKRKDVSLSIDLFQAGLLFPNLNMQKQHFKLQL